MKKRFLNAYFILVLAAMPLSPALAQTQPEFDQNYVLADIDLTDHESLTLEQIQSFLESKGSGLATYVEPITSLKAAQIIYRSAQDFQISPKFLLALVQKEQSLVENSNPSQYNFDWATGYAVCDGCDISDPLIQKFKGFYNQVYNAAKRIRVDYLSSLEKTGRTISGFGPGVPKQVDGVTVVPANKATAIVYTYTPHLKGNKLLWTVWNRYFTRAYPDGTLLNVDGEKEVWLIEAGQRRKFAGRTIFLSRYTDFNKVITINRTELLKYAEGRPIKLANYSFVRVPKGTVYLVVDDSVRGFASREALRKVGVNPEEIQNVKVDDLLDYGEGPAITTKSIFPLGSLIQDRTTGGVFWVQDGVKHPIWSREILKSNFGTRKITKAKAGQLDQYPSSTPVMFREGELVRGKTDATVYLISNKLRRPFASDDALKELGFDPKLVLTTSDEALAIHGLGEPIIASF